MTNAEIIMRESLALVEQGILATKTAEMVDMNGEVVEMEVPEEIHTFDGWKKMGYVVRKGQHAIAKFPVWSPTKASRKKIAEALENGEEAPKMNMYMRNAAWFKFDQVEKPEEKKPEEVKTEEPKKPEKPKKTAKPKKSEKSKTEPTVTKEEEYKALKADLRKATLKKNMGKRYMLVARSGKSVYLCDSGWLIKKISLTDYNKYFKDTAKYFKELKDGEGYKAENGDIANPAPELAKMFTGFIEDRVQKAHKVECTDLHYVYALDDGRFVKALQCGDEIIGVNTDLLKALPAEKWFANPETPFEPVVSTTAAILPIRMGEDFVEDVRKACQC